jgi:predicted CXXCH cytochrome family protein
MVAVGGSQVHATSADPHSNPTIIVRPCEPCHRGHGATGTTMLRDGDDAACLNCHDPRADQPEYRRMLGMSPGANPADIRSELVKPSTHSMVSCRSCHSVHGVELIDRPSPTVVVRGVPKRSTLRGHELERELCLSCHGGNNLPEHDPGNIERLLDPRNPSSHPVLAPGSSTSPSVLPFLPQGSVINCTDCHGGEHGSPLGPHGSFTPMILGHEYSVGDGTDESESTYALCYLCHDRKTVLENDPFPLHQLHSVATRASCSTCHNPHGATDGRALIRFNDSTSMTGVAPAASGRLGFDSLSEGSGLCYLSCHGKNHDPLGYGPGFNATGSPNIALPGDRPRSAPIHPGELGTEAQESSSRHSKSAGR